MAFTGQPLKPSFMGPGNLLSQGQELVKRNLVRPQPHCYWFLAPSHQWGTKSFNPGTDTCNHQENQGWILP